MINQWVSSYYWQLRTDTHPLSQLLPTYPSEKTFLPPFSCMKTVSVAKKLPQSSTARNLSNSKAHHLFSAALAPLPWSSLPQYPFFLYSEALEHRAGGREVMGRRGHGQERSSPLHLPCFSRTWMFIPFIYPLALALWSQPPVREWGRFYWPPYLTSPCPSHFISFHSTLFPLYLTSSDIVLLISLVSRCSSTSHQNVSSIKANFLSPRMYPHAHYNGCQVSKKYLLNEWISKQMDEIKSESVFKLCNRKNWGLKLWKTRFKSKFLNVLIVWLGKLCSFSDFCFIIFKIELKILPS